jgi:hypothetical protein
MDEKSGRISANIPFELLAPNAGVPGIAQLMRRYDLKRL